MSAPGDDGRPKTVDPETQNKDRPREQDIVPQSDGLRGMLCVDREGLSCRNEQR